MKKKKLPMHDVETAPSLVESNNVSHLQIKDVRLDEQSADNSTTTCGICGAPHSITGCNVIEMKAHIEDNIVQTKARLTLPSTLRLEKMSEGSDSVVTADKIEKGTRFGPFEAKKLFTLNPEISFPLKVFTPNDYFSEYYLDTNDEDECNWMMFVHPAQDLAEQNLMCYQDDLKIFFMSVRDIAAGEFLKVWYSPVYARKMNKNVLTTAVDAPENVLDLNALLKKQQNLMEREVWTCKFCNVQEKDVTKFVKHILQHYSMQMRKVCEICKSAFLTHKRLKRHIRIVHANLSQSPREMANEIVVQNAKRRGGARDSMLGGPLLNDVLTDSMDNTNLLLHQTDISRFDMHDMDNSDILLDNENLNLAVDNLIQDDDHFNFNIDKDKEEHVCDICLKPFAKLRRLIQHLQKHTGKYTCPDCLVIFSRNENLRAHVCNLHKRELHKCPMCQKRFALKKYLSRHIQSVHEKKKRICPKCDRSYHSGNELRDHNCSAVPESEKERYPCLLCNKVFFRESYVTKHMKSHAPNREKEEKNEVLICEICAKTFGTSRNLKRHKRTHNQLSYPCSKCCKSFRRSDTLNHHVIVEHSSNTYPCPICGKVYKSKKYLNLHTNIHSAREKLQCTACNRKFFQRSSMLKHFKLKHPAKCAECDRSDCEHLKTLVECYECPLCQKLLKLRSSLVRHMKITHQHVQIDGSKIKTVRKMLHSSKKNGTKEEREGGNREPIGGGAGNREDELLRNIEFENVGAKLRRNDELRISNETSLIDLNNLTIEFNGEDVTNQEICLSMPELTEIGRDVTLSDNAYVLENGTIVEPLDSENVVVYVFDKE